FARLEVCAARPETGEGERRAVREPKVDRIAPAACAGPPLVEPVREDETAVTAEERAKRRLLRERLGSRVDQLVGDLRVLRPVRQEAPADESRLAPAVAGTDDRDTLPGGDVVALAVAVGQLDREAFP